MLIIVFCLTLISTTLSFPNTLSKIRKLIKRAVVQADDVSSLDVLQWVIENGGIVGNVEIHQCTSSERDVCATSLIQEGELLFSIPRKCILTVDMGIVTQAGLRLKSTGKAMNLNDHISYLAFILLEEKSKIQLGNPSFFKPFIESMPLMNDFVHIPLFWSRGDISELQASPLVELLSRRRDLIAADLSELTESYCSTSERVITVNENDFFWAYTAVSSRTFGFNEQYPEYKMSMMVPIADMLNDDSQNNLDWDWDADSDTFRVRALQPIPAGSPLHITYGHMPNYMRLLNYGFVLNTDMKDNSWAAAEESSHQVIFTIPLASPCYDDDGAVSKLTTQGESIEAYVTQQTLNAAKERFWKEAGDGSLSLSCLLGIGCFQAAASSLAFIRIAVGNDEDIETLKERRYSNWWHDWMKTRVGSIEPALDTTLTQSKNELSQSPEGLFSASSSSSSSSSSPPSSPSSPSSSTSSRFASTPVNDDEATAPEISTAAALTPLSWRNERAAIRAFGALASLALDAYSTTYEQDAIILLQSTSHSGNQKPGSLEPRHIADSPLEKNADGEAFISRNRINAIIVRMGEKKVLRHFIRTADMLEAHLDMDIELFGRGITALGSVGAGGGTSGLVDRGGIKDESSAVSGASRGRRRGGGRDALDYASADSAATAVAGVAGAGAGAGAGAEGGAAGEPRWDGNDAAEYLAWREYDALLHSALSSRGEEFADI